MLLPSRPVPRARHRARGLEILTADAEGAAQSGSETWNDSAGSAWRKTRLHLHVNMPNMTSASGSWILNFAELNETTRVRT